MHQNYLFSLECYPWKDFQHHRHTAWRHEYCRYLARRSKIRSTQFQAWGNTSYCLTCGSKSRSESQKIEEIMRCWWSMSRIKRLQLARWYRRGSKAFEFTASNASGFPQEIPHGPAITKEISSHYRPQATAPQSYRFKSCISRPLPCAHPASPGWHSLPGRPQGRHEVAACKHFTGHRCDWASLSAYIPPLSHLVYRSRCFLAQLQIIL